MQEWMTILEVQRALASKLAGGISSVQQRSELSPDVVDRIRKAINRQQEIALNVRAGAVAANDSVVESVANEILEQWSHLLAMIEGRSSSMPHV